MTGNKVLIASGSFKDVFTSSESGEMIRKLLAHDYETEVVSVCDGGEYTFDVLRSYYNENAVVHTVNDVLNPYFKKVNVPFLGVGDTAYVVSSEILHLSLEEDRYKNPLNLTDYGLGQVISAGIMAGYKRICLCLGGTSTIGFGLGVIQALGCRLLDSENREINDPICLKDYPLIQRIEWCSGEYQDIEILVINDGITRGCDLFRVNPIKIGNCYSREKEEILTEIERITEQVYRLTGLSPEDAFSGNGGGIFYGIHQLFHPAYLKGAEYFCDLFHLDEKIQLCDLVITGEGRFDNPDLGKTPVVVSKYAKRLNKPVIYVCGEIAPEWGPDCSGINHIPELKEQYGIDVILSCSEDYQADTLSEENRTQYYKENTPVILKKRFKQIGVISHE